MEIKAVEFESNGRRLVGVIHLPDKPRGAVVICHGIKGNKNEGGVLTTCAQALCDRGFAVLRFDFTGHGESEGTVWDIRLSNQVKDLHAAVELVKRESGASKIGLVGFSFGGSTSILYAAKNKVDAMVLWAPAINFRSSFKKVNKFSSEAYLVLKIFVGWLSRAAVQEVRKLNLTEYASKIKCPILIIQGRLDQRTRWRWAKQFFEALRVQARLRTVKTAGHLTFFFRPFLKRKILRWTTGWLEEYLV